MPKTAKRSPKSPQPRPPEPQSNFLARWLPHADWSAALLYLAIFGILDLPSIRISYEWMHHTNLLMSSLRILQGQVPFLDFYPWYGPLFHYLVAFWVWLLGGNLLAVKLFVKVISPLLSLAMLVATLRLFRLEAGGRLFAVTANVWWIYECYFHTGATRTFLGLFLIGLWMAGIRNPRRVSGRLLVFPSTLLAFFYSPEIGLYLLPVVLIIVFFDLLQLPSPWRKNSFLAYGAGALLTIGLFSAAYLNLSWVNNYLHFFLYTSSNMIWAYSLPFPELSEFFNHPRNLLYFLPWLVMMTALAWIFMTVRRGQISQVPIWMPACVVYGVMLWTTTYLRTDKGHLLFALPPITILMGKLFSRPSPGGAIKIALLALILWGFPFFLDNPPNLNYWKNILLPRQTKKLKDWRQFSGVLELPEETKMVKALEAFIQALPQDRILFPLRSFEAYHLGQPLLLPFDDLFWANYPEQQKKLLALVQNLNPAYLCLDASHWYNAYTHEDSDALFDFIATHYRFVQLLSSAIVYERLPAPRVLAQKIQSLPGPILLSNQNSFQTEWQLPDGFSGGYLEMNESFSYSSRLLQRFSLPLVKILLDHHPINRPITDGLSRIRNTAGGGTYRVYVPHDVKKVTLQILCPGILNLKPEAVTLKDIGFYQFNFPPNVPYTAQFIDKGY